MTSNVHPTIQFQLQAAQLYSTWYGANQGNDESKDKEGKPADEECKDNQTDLNFELVLACGPIFAQMRLEDKP